jgi:DNA helicase-2/ATP-dependent DNA helicase PcrA
MDFDDLLFNTSILLREFPDVLNKYQQRFKYVMIDEFQDTNLTQYYITKKLAAANQNIVIVGDDAQSIYAFRGASIQNILNFEKDYPELKVFKLEQNYRSTQTIVEAANSVISKNTAQLKKNVWTSNDTGDLINVIGSQSDGEEAKLIANSIYENKVKKQEEYADFAILYRTNSQSRSIEEALRRLSLPYRIYGGLSFYQRKEIKDLIAYLRFTVNTNDEQALKRIITLPKRGIGDTSVAKVLVYANDNGVTLWEALTKVRSYISGRTAMAIENFCILIKSFQIEAESKDAFEVAQQIAKAAGIIKELYNDKSVEGLARYENVQELLNGVKGFVDNDEQEDKSLGAFLQEVSLLTDADNTSEDADHITLMTIHSSKGLEFKNVYLCGMEEDLFPSQMMLESRADLEEERRLFYVAVTRAEKCLTLSYALSRYRFGRQKNCEPSRFIEEIDEKFINQNKKPRLDGVFGRDDDNVAVAGFSKNYSGLLKSVKKANTQKTFKSTYKAPTDFVPDDTSNLQEGMKVEHPKFGFGKVKTIDTKGESKKAIVNFEQVGEKTLLLSFAKLKIHA